ncbi:recombinase family protein [Ruminococcus flavefaciens]|uniref:recombinase family protein n=1 Tax=Ruminococcus flavefaciens TaxID=1265 RepID=UPI0013DA7A3A|nr:recombinase family protein [Ruminococcus flavefaciens]
MVYGYCCISTKKQSMDRQIKNIKEAFSKAEIIKETCSGASLNRPEWEKLFRRLENNDVIVFDSVSKMGIDAAEAFVLYKELVCKNIRLVFIRERYLDTESYREALNGIISLSLSPEEQAANNLLKGVMSAVDHFIMNKIEQDIYKAYAQSEKKIKELSRRTSEGIEAARSSGKQIGTVKGAVHETKKSKAVKPLIIKLSKDFEGELSDKECMKLIGLSNNTYYKYKRELKRDHIERGA